MPKIKYCYNELYFFNEDDVAIFLILYTLYQLPPLLILLYFLLLPY